MKREQWKRIICEKLRVNYGTNTEPSGSWTPKALPEPAKGGFTKSLAVQELRENNGTQGKSQTLSREEVVAGKVPGEARLCGHLHQILNQPGPASWRLTPCSSSRQQPGSKRTRLTPKTCCLVGFIGTGQQLLASGCWPCWVSPAPAGPRAGGTAGSWTTERERNVTRLSCLLFRDKSKEMGCSPVQEAGFGNPQAVKPCGLPRLLPCPEAV